MEKCCRATLRRSLAMLVFVVIRIAAATPPFATNLVGNPSCEKSGGVDMAPWAANYMYPDADAYCSADASASMKTYMDGYRYFSGGTKGTALIEYTIDLKDFLGNIQKREVQFLASARIGGKGLSPDTATVSFYFLNKKGTAIGYETVLPEPERGLITPARRGNRDKMIYQQMTEELCIDPSVERVWVRIKLNDTNGDGINDAAADLVSFRLFRVSRKQCEDTKTIPPTHTNSLVLTPDPTRTQSKDVSPSITALDPPPANATTTVVPAETRTRSEDVSSSLTQSRTSLLCTKTATEPLRHADATATSEAAATELPTAAPTSAATNQPVGSTVNSSVSEPPRRTERITTNLLMPNSEVAATVVLSTAGASGAIASTLGSGGGGVVVTAGSSVRMMECGLAEDDPQPARFELPIQFAIGSGIMRFFAGAALAHTLVHCVLLGAAVFLRRQLATAESSTSKVVNLLRLTFCGAHPFFTPAILGACSTVLFNDDDTTSLAVCACSVVIVTAIHAMVVLAVHRGRANGLVTRSVRNNRGGKAKLEFKIDPNCVVAPHSEDDSIPPPPTALLFSAAATKDILLTLFDGCRIYEKATHRHYASIETTLTSLIAIISGARPQQNCSVAAFAIGVLAALQLSYVVFTLPFRTKLDTIFSVLNSAVLVVLSMAVAISVQRRNSSDNINTQEEWALKTVEVCLWTISGLGFVQLIVQVCWAHHVERRRRRRNARDDSSDSDSSEDGIKFKFNATMKPLLVPVEMNSINQDGVHNPLLQSKA